MVSISRNEISAVPGWAKSYDAAVLADNPWSEICFDGRPPSFLEVDGAKEIGVEFHTLSKSYNCCGWRTGMLVGNKEIISTDYLNP
jgi:LL-diaminopimelate aminotransferase